MTSTTNIEPVPPLIPASITYQTNYTRTIECSSLYINGVLTDGTLQINNGSITNLNNPVNDTDICNKQYVLSKGIFAYGENGSVQYNNNGTFGSSNNFVFDGTNCSINNLAIANSIIIENNTISGIVNPSNLTPNQPINKNYIDNYFRGNFNGSSSPSSITYTNMAYALFTRTGLIENTSDSTDSAVNIINETFYNQTGGSCSFVLINNSNYNLTLTMGLGVTNSLLSTNSSILLYPNYVLDSLLYIQSPSNVYMLVLSITNSTETNFVQGPRSQYITSNNTIITNNFQQNTGTKTISNINYIYGPTDNIVFRNYPGNMIDSFGPISSYISGPSYIQGYSGFGVYSSNYYVFETGAIKLIIVNNSNTINGTGGSLSFTNLYVDTAYQWNFDPNSNMIIPAGYTGEFYVGIDTVNIIGYIYVIGIYPT